MRPLTDSEARQVYLFARKAPPFMGGMDSVVAERR